MESHTTYLPILQNTLYPSQGLLPDAATLEILTPGYKSVTLSSPTWVQTEALPIRGREEPSSAVSARAGPPQSVLADSMPLL